MTDDSRATRILGRLEALREADAPTHGGRVLSYVYDSGLTELDDLAAAVTRLVQPVNGLDPTVFTSVAAMEREVIAFGRTIFHGDQTVGTVTSGGTESCVLAVKAARDHAGVVAGSGAIVVPSTAHAAFDKAAKLLGVQIIRVPVDVVTTAVTVDAVASALRDDTFLIVASAPNYPTGTADPIVELGQLAVERELPLHVDACLGGFALAWWPDESLAPWDFRVPGVSSLSADLHKYGYTPKGASLLLHADRDRHRAQYFATTDWPGYPVVNPTLLGSRSVAGLAASWAIIEYLGEDGFGDLVARVADSSRQLISAVESIDGLRVVGEPVGPVFAVASDPTSGTVVDTHRWSQAVTRRGFALQVQPRYPQADGTVLPPTTHLTITPVTERIVDELVDVFVEAADEVRGLPPQSPPQALADLAELLANGSLDVDAVLGLPSEATAAALVAAGVDPHGAGSSELDMPAIVAAVQALPRSVTAKMLAEFLASFTNPA
ncbi:putative lyase [Gordonia effusa NBRC 100432]|uniref:Putative lyase n=1 Tax=Gordonia effusa NBRC 100432 TaxID=1077974 RepID=H0QW72_9ACTN|nr:aminotransferase class V-fold PLP-dependent enzyme [Gordonia effusa]GAB17073.1 putative lyase [Gordonia effusa NBRC 100432]